MENPATWSKAERVVDAALEKSYEADREMLIGASRTRQVTDALIKAGLLVLSEVDQDRMLMYEEGERVGVMGTDGVPTIYRVMNGKFEIIDPSTTEWVQDD